MKTEEQYTSIVVHISWQLPAVKAINIHSLNRNTNDISDLDTSMAFHEISPSGNLPIG